MLSINDPQGMALRKEYFKASSFTMFRFES